jgi:hypothetical protein
MSFLLGNRTNWCHSCWGTGQTDVIPVGEPDKLMSFLLGNRTNW